MPVRLPVLTLQVSWFFSFDNYVRDNRIIAIKLFAIELVFAAKPEPRARSASADT
jgi:hypothetical protein